MDAVRFDDAEALCVAWRARDRWSASAQRFGRGLEWSGDGATAEEAARAARGAAGACGPLPARSGQG